MRPVFDMHPAPGMDAALVDTILIVEDDEAIREMLALCIDIETPYRALSLASVENALQDRDTLQETSIVLFILDCSLLMQNAIDLYDHLCNLIEFEHAPAIVLTTRRPDRTLEFALAKRGLKLLLKPFDISDLLHYIEQALTRPTQLI